MEIRRVFVDKLKMKNGMVLLTGPMYKYIVNVLRKTTGDRIDLIDGKGYLYRCTINSIKSKELDLQVVDVVHHPEEKRPRVTLCVSPIKGPRMDWLVEKATELRVEKIVPTIFKRTLIKFNDREKGKLERWKRIVIEASRQSGRFTVPDVVEPIPLRGILTYAESIPNRWAFYEQEREVSLNSVLSNRKEGGEICLVIGPEGGIDDLEIEWLKEKNFTLCTLGENIFRTETTPLVILSVILHEYFNKYK